MCDLRYGFILLLDLRYLNTKRHYTETKSVVDESYLPGSIENLSFCLTRVGSQTCFVCTGLCACYFRGMKEKTFLSRSSFVSIEYF